MPTTRTLVRAALLLAVPLSLSAVGAARPERSRRELVCARPSLSPRVPQTSVLRAGVVPSPSAHSVGPTPSTARAGVPVPLNPTTLDSFPLRLEITANPYSYRVTEKSTGKILLAQVRHLRRKPSARPFRVRACGPCQLHLQHAQLTYGIRYGPTYADIFRRCNAIAGPPPSPTRAITCPWSAATTSNSTPSLRN